MKRVVLTIVISVLGFVFLVGGAGFAYYMHERHTVDFGKYDETVLRTGDVPSGAEDRRVKIPSFAGANINGFDPAYYDCYAEVDQACMAYAQYVLMKYGNADLDFTVELRGDTLEIKLFGTGYPEVGEPEKLERNYIYNVKDVGRDKLPSLMNRAEFIGY